MDNINDQPGEYHRKHVQAALDWAETEAETRRKCGHEFIAGKLTTIAAHCRRLEQRVAEQDAHVSTCHRILAERDAKLESLDMANEDNALKARLSDERWAKAEAALAAAQANAHQSQCNAQAADNWRNECATLSEQLSAAQAERDQWKTCAENIDRKMLHEQADHNKTVDRLLAAQKRIGELEASFAHVVLNELKTDVCSLRDQLAAARRQLEEMGAALRDGLMEFDNVWGNLMVAPAARRDGVERAIATFRAALAPVVERGAEQKPDIEFFDAASQRQMKLVGAGEWAGWICYKHPDGMWVSLRKATPDDLARLGEPAAQPEQKEGG